MKPPENRICGDAKNSTLVQFVLGKHLLFVENSYIMVLYKNTYYYEVENGCKL